MLAVRSGGTEGCTSSVKTPNAKPSTQRLQKLGRGVLPNKGNQAWAPCLVYGASCLGFRVLAFSFGVWDLGTTPNYPTVEALELETP